VIVDASFREEKRRRTFLEAALALGVRGVFFRCSASPETVERRLSDRRGGPSDADWSIYQAAAEAWDANAASDPRWTAGQVSNDRGADEAVGAGLGHLRELGLSRMPEAGA